MAPHSAASAHAGGDCRSVHVGSGRLRSRQRDRRFIECNILDLAGYRRNRHELLALQLDKFLRNFRGAICGNAQQRRRGQRDLVGKRRRCELRGGRNFLKRTVHAAQLSHGRQHSRRCHGHSQLQFKHQGKLSAQRVTPGVPAAPCAGKRILRQRRDDKHYRLHCGSGRLGQH